MTLADSSEIFRLCRTYFSMASIWTAPELDFRHEITALSKASLFGNWADTGTPHTNRLRVYKLHALNQKFNELSV